MRISKSMKRVVVGFGVFVLLALVTALALPFLVDFQRFKPQIQALVGEKVNAAVDFESARLTLLPRLGVRLTNLTVTNTDPDFRDVRLFAAEAAVFQVELRPLLQRRLVGELIVDQPDIVFARRGVKNNFGALVKAPDAAAPKRDAKPTPAEQRQRDEAFEILRERVVIEAVSIRGARFQLQDLSTGGKAAAVSERITDLDLTMRNIGLERDITTVLTATVHADEAGGRVAGPVELTMTTNVALGASGLERAKFRGKVDLAGLAINVRDALVKPRGVPFDADFAGELRAHALDVDQLVINLDKLALVASAQILDVRTMATKATATFRSDDLAALGNLLPQHRQLLTAGTVDIEASLTGKLTELAQVDVSARLIAKLTGSDLTADLRVDGLKPAKITLKARSSRLDVGALVGPFLTTKPGTKTAGGEPKSEPTLAGSAATQPEAKGPATEQPARATADGGEPAQDFSLTPAQKARLEGAVISFDGDAGEVLYGGVVVRNLVGRFRQLGLEAMLERLDFDALGGTLKTKGRIDLAASPIAFEQSMDVTGVAAERLLGFLSPGQRDLLSGRLSLSLQVAGRGTTLATVRETLDGKGRFELKDGELHASAVTPQMQADFERFVSGLSIVKAGDRSFKAAEAALSHPLVKALTARQSFDLAAYKARYDSLRKVSLAGELGADRPLGDVTGQLVIEDGRVGLKAIRATPAGTFDLDGSVGLDLSLVGTVLFKASESTKAKLLAQSNYAKLLFDDAGGLVLDLRLAGTALAPALALDVASLEARFKDNAQKLVAAEIEKGAKEHLAKAMGSQKEALVESAKKAFEAEKAKGADSKVNQEIEKAKQKLKGLLGG